MANTWNGTPSRVPGKDYVSPTCFVSKCAIMSSPLMCFGQYLRFFISALANTPRFFNSIRALSTQNPESNITTIPMWNMVSQSRNKSDVVVLFFATDENFLAGFSFGQSLPSTSSTAYITPDVQQQMVWYSFPRGQGFLGTTIWPGQVYLLVHGNIDSSRQDTHPGWKILSML